GEADAEAWGRARLLGPGASREAVLVVDDLEALDGVPAAGAGFPAPVPDPSWGLVVDGTDPAREREVESWLTVGNGRTGTRGSLDMPGPTSLPALYVAGIFGSDPAGQAGPELVRGPEWTTLQVQGDAVAGRRRTLDLRQGMLFGESDGFRSARYASLADRRVLVLESEGAEPGEVAVPAVTGPVEAVDAAATGRGAHIRVQGRKGATVWFAVSDVDEGGRAVRIVAVDRDGPAHDALTRAEAQGAGELLARHRRAWRERWFDADVVVGGDPQAQRDLRFALYHLMISGDPGSDRAHIGAR
ncbi:MAG: hypothetical protein ACR2HV_11350, partial [Acidimicrobiales bacterium]